jgi:hypothetical protein
MLGSFVIGNPPIKLKGKSTSGLPLTYASSDTTIIAVSDSTISFKKIGPCTITATQLGDSIYRVAPLVQQTICVSPTQPTVSHGSPTPDFLLTSSAASGNQWFFNGTAITSATNQTLTASVTGTYAVQVTTNGCSSEMSADQNLVITGDITTNSGNYIQLYPNPAKNTVLIDLNNFPTQELVSVEVIDLLGRNLDHQQAQGGAVMGLNVSAYSSGIYLVNIRQQANVYRAKFVKE